jgi:hypothetical protein
MGGRLSPNEPRAHWFLWIEAERKWLGPAASIGIGDERGSSLLDRAGNDCHMQRLMGS